MKEMIGRFIASAVLKSWQTTLIGFLAAVAQLLYPLYLNGQMPNKQQILQACFFAAMGLFAKSHNVTGGPTQLPDSLKDKQGA